MTARTRWILAIVALLGGNIVAMVIVAVLAAIQGSQVVPGYDRPAVPVPTDRRPTDDQPPQQPSRAR